MGSSSRSWEILYIHNGQVRNQPISGDSSAFVEQELKKLPGAVRVVLVLQISHSLFRRKPKGRVHSYTPQHSLSERHNLFVFLRTHYANGEEIVQEVERAQQDAVRTNKIERYSYNRSIDSRWALEKVIKDHLVARPILLVFTVQGSKLWKTQRAVFVPVLVDYENSIQAYELCYDKEQDGHREIKWLFYHFRVKRIPSWLLLTPERRKGKIAVTISRFEQFRERYFTQQASQQQREMDKDEKNDVSEAFERFVLWGISRVNACHIRLGG